LPFEPKFRFLEFGFSFEARNFFSCLFSAYPLDKWYGLDPDLVQLLKNNVVTFHNERALSFQLDSAEQNTLIAAAECKAKLRPTGTRFAAS